MNEMIKAERNKICSRKQTRMLFLAGVVLIVAYFFFFQFNYQNVFYDYDLEKMALASGFTAIEQRKEVAEIFEGKLSQNTLLTMQEKIFQCWINIPSGSAWCFLRNNPQPFCTIIMFQICCYIVQF